jgi:iron uptake system component EfeO
VKACSADLAAMMRGLPRAALEAFFLGAVLSALALALVACGSSDYEAPTGAAVSEQPQGQSNPELEATVADYRGYLGRNARQLVAETRGFVAAVLAGDLARAKRLYAPARAPFERIEPVADAFPDLDRRIDARQNEVTPSEFAGFHRIERALWQQGTVDGTAAVATRLLADVEELQEKAETVELQATQIANGANELLAEVSAAKITGEEERYSHTDLVDLEANVEGAEAAFRAVEPLLATADPELEKEIERGFDDVYSALAPYRRGDGFVPYTQLSQSDTRKLAQEIDALAENLSEVPAVIAASE